MLESKTKPAEELDAYWLHIKNAGNNKKKRMIHISIVENAMFLVKKIAGNISAQSGIALEDLIQVGSIGLIKCY